MPCWDSVVSVVTVLRSGRAGVRFSAGEIFSSLKGPDLLWYHQNFTFSGYQGSSPEVRPLRREVKPLTSVYCLC
jgi:hypothetical protein